MVGHRRTPGMEHGGDADADAEMLRVGGDRQHRLRRGLEQQVVDERLVLQGDVGDRGGDGEDDVEIADRQQVGLALGEPGARGGPLALRTMPVAAAVVGDAPMAAVLAGLDVTAERGGTAGLDRRHDLELGKAQVPGMGSPVGRAGRTEDVGDVEGGAHRLSRKASCPPSAPSAGRAARRPHGSSGSRPWCRARWSPACCARAAPG